MAGRHALQRRVLGQATVELMDNLDRIVKEKKEHNLDVRTRKRREKV